MKDLKVFISYRRSDTQHVAGRLGDRMSQRFTLFMDIDDIPIGEDFTTVVRRAVNESDVLLVLIGPQFLAVDQEGRRRLDRPGDWVAEEIAAGLNRDITVVPVLVDGATMPDDDELPTLLKPLRHRQALSLSHATFNANAERLIDALIRIEGGRHREADRGPAELINDPEYAWATAAEFNQRWSEAIELFTALDHRYPDDDRVRRALRTADLQLESGVVQGYHVNRFVSMREDLTYAEVSVDDSGSPPHKINYSTGWASGSRTGAFGDGFHYTRTADATATMASPVRVCGSGIPPQPASARRT